MKVQIDVDDGNYIQLQTYSDGDTTILIRDSGGVTCVTMQKNCIKKLISALQEELEKSNEKE